MWGARGGVGSKRFPFPLLQSCLYPESEAGCSQFLGLQVFPLLAEELKNKIKRRSQFLFLISSRAVWCPYLMDECIPHRLLMQRDLTWVMKQETQSKHQGKEMVSLVQSQTPPNYCLHFKAVNREGSLFLFQDICLFCN